MQTLPPTADSPFALLMTEIPPGIDLVDVRNDRRNKHESKMSWSAGSKSRKQQLESNTASRCVKQMPFIANRQRDTLRERRIALRMPVSVSGVATRACVVSRPRISSPDGTVPPYAAFATTPMLFSLLTMDWRSSAAKDRKGTSITAAAPGVSVRWAKSKASHSAVFPAPVGICKEKDSFRSNRPCSIARICEGKKSQFPRRTNDSTNGRHRGDQPSGSTALRFEISNRSKSGCSSLKGTHSSGPSKSAALACVAASLAAREMPSRSPRTRASVRSCTRPEVGSLGRARKSTHACSLSRSPSSAMPLRVTYAEAGYPPK